MIKNKAILSILILLISLTKFAFSDNNIQMLVKFDVENPQLLSEPTLGNNTENYKFGCSGMTTSTYPNGYTITGYNQTDQGMVIGINGPFPEDQRETCTINDQTTGNVNHVYFTLESMPIFFKYNGVLHSCYINKKIGTSWNQANRKNNKLQGEQSDAILPCNGLVGTDSYKINAGSGDDKGNITIITKTSSIGVQVSFFNNTGESNLTLESIAIESYTMNCGNMYTFNNMNYRPSWESMFFSVIGPFQSDPRNTCKMKSYSMGVHTSEVNDVYFVVDYFKLSYKVNGTTHICNLYTTFGTSYDRNSGRYDKLQQTTRGAWPNCDGDNSDQYQIISGSHLTVDYNYNPGQIIIHIYKP